MKLFMLCVFIFFARICDVSLGTIRTIMTVKGKNSLAMFFGFLEVFIWFLVARNALNSDQNSLFIIIAYSAGYATGTYIGGVLAGLIKSKLCIQIIIDENNIDLIDELRGEGYAVSVIDVEGYENESSKYMLLLEIDNHKFKNIEKIVKKHNDKIFMMVNDTKYVQNGYFGGIAK